MLNNIIVYKATKLEIFLSKVIPYYVPFINKRKRVIIRNYFRYKYRHRLMKDMTNLLNNKYVNRLPLPTKEIKWYDWEWEVIPPTNN